MGLSTTAKMQQDVTVGMGQIATAQGPDRLKAVLGSCVGVAVYHPRFRTGALAHVVLPKSAGRTGSPGKFADTAVPCIVEKLKTVGISPFGLVAIITGGAAMFAGSGPMQVGDANVEAVTRALSAAQIRVTAEDVGGTSGRRLTFDCSNGELLIEIVGKPPRIL